LIKIILVTSAVVRIAVVVGVKAVVGGGCW
jgi:hypothetical protein